MTTKIKEDFIVNDFRVVPVIIYNKYTRLSFYRYLIYFNNLSMGYISDYMKLNTSYFKKCFAAGDYSLKKYSSLSMLNYK